ncbi:MAG: gamma-glutamyltransferase [Alphaproteobacteria bacterium]|nr:gamma-glutamyltransferase [Alphaproteobacteria bacterium]
MIGLRDGWRLAIGSALAAALLGLAACGGGASAPEAASLPPPGPDSRVGDFRGVAAVIADEPQAAAVGRSVLEQGGNVADAATALYFALSVTHPAAASLGGGGICLYREAAGRSAESYDFLVREARAGGSIGLPGNVAGFGLLHERHGRLPWKALLVPAMGLAESGADVSPTLARRLAGAAGRIAASPTLATRFRASDGKVLAAGNRLYQPELAITLSFIREGGAAAFYKGILAHSIAEAVQQLDGAVRFDDLASYEVGLAPAQGTDGAARALYAPSQRTGAGILHAAVTNRTLAQSRGVLPTGLGLVDSVEAELSTRGAPKLPRDVGSTVFLVADAKGEAVACALTMGVPFGAGLAVPQLGIVLPPSPDGTAGLASALLAPVIVADPKGGDLYGVAVGAGGSWGIASALEAGLAASTANGMGIAQIALGGLASETAPVDVLLCPGGIMAAPETCRFGAFAPDGVALAVQAAP